MIDSLIWLSFNVLRAGYIRDKLQRKIRKPRGLAAPTHKQKGKTLRLPSNPLLRNQTIHPHRPFLLPICLGVQSRAATSWSPLQCSKTCERVIRLQLLPNHYSERKISKAEPAERAVPKPIPPDMFTSESDRRYGKKSVYRKPGKAPEADFLVMRNHLA